MNKIVVIVSLFVISRSESSYYHKRLSFNGGLCDYEPYMQIFLRLIM